MRARGVFKPQKESERAILPSVVRKLLLAPQAAVNIVFLTLIMQTYKCDFILKKETYTSLLKHDA